MKAISLHEVMGYFLFRFSFFPSYLLFLHISSVCFNHEARALLHRWCVQIKFPTEQKNVLNVHNPHIFCTSIFLFIFFFLSPFLTLSANPNVFFNRTVFKLKWSVKKKCIIWKLSIIFNLSIKNKIKEVYINTNQPA